MNIRLLLIAFGYFHTFRATLSEEAVLGESPTDHAQIDHYAGQLIDALRKMDRVEVPLKRLRKESNESLAPQSNDEIVSRLCKLVDTLSRDEVSFVSWASELIVLASAHERLRGMVVREFKLLIERSELENEASISDSIGLSTFNEQYPPNDWEIAFRSQQRAEKVAALPWQEFANQIELLIDLALESAKTMTVEAVLQVSENPLGYKELGMNPPAARVEGYVKHLISVGSRDPWNMFLNHGAIFNVLGIDWDTFEDGKLKAEIPGLNYKLLDRLGARLVTVLLSIPTTSDHDLLSVSKSVGLHSYAAKRPASILSHLAAELESNPRLLQMIGEDFDKALWSLSAPFDAATLMEFTSVAAQIVSCTTSDDILVFVGNSPSYFYHPVKLIRPRSFLIPFSGGSEPENKPKFFELNESLEKYDELFLEPIRRLARDSTKPVSLVYIDKSVSGQSVEIFDQLLRRKDNDLFTHESELIQIAPIDGFYWVLPSNPKHVQIRKMIVVPRPVGSEYMMEGYIRLVPSFSRSLWDVSSDALVRVFESRPGPANYIKSIHEFVNQHGLSTVEDSSPLVTLAEYPTPERSDFWQPHVKIPLSVWTNELVRMINQMSSVNLDEQSDEFEMGDFNPLESNAHVAAALTSLIKAREAFTEPEFVAWASEIVFLATHIEHVRETLIPPLIKLVDRTNDADVRKTIYRETGLGALLTRHPHLSTQ